MPSEGFEPAIPAGEQLQTHALDRLATGIGTSLYYVPNIFCENVENIYRKSIFTKKARLIISKRINVDTVGQLG
jgi:hypothetical protein